MSFVKKKLFSPTEGVQLTSRGCIRMHRKEYLSVKRTNSITSSPPLKKAKDYHTQNIELDHERKLREKNDEIAELKSLVAQLKQQIKFKVNKETPLEVRKQDPNIRELSPSVKPLVEKGSKEYVV